MILTSSFADGMQCSAVVIMAAHTECGVMQTSRTSSRNTLANRIIFDCPVRKNGRTEFQEIPFILAVLANLSGRVAASDQATRATRFIDARPGGINELIKGIRPSLRLAVRNDISPLPATTQLIFELEFESLQDFEPQRIAARLPELRKLVQESSAMYAGPQTHVCETNSRIAKQLDAILHEPSFESLHATWLGIDTILKRSATVPSARIAILDIAKEGLTSIQDANSVSEALRDAMRTMNLDTYGGHSPMAILADFQFGPEDVQMLGVLARMAEGMHTTFMGSASPAFLPRDRFSELNDIDRTNLHHDTMTVFNDWRAFRRQEISKNVFLILPPVLLRPPYEAVALTTPEGSAACSCHYNESVDPSETSNYLWGSGVYAIGSILIASFAQYGWVAAISPLASSDLTLDYYVHRRESGPNPVSVGPTTASVWHHTARSSPRWDS